VIAAARDTTGGWVVATERALLVGDRRVPWTDVLHAKWDGEQQVLAVDLAAGGASSIRVGLADPGRLPETVHERVMDSIVLSRRVPVRGGGVRVVARRGDGSDDTLWQVVPDAGTDLADPAVRDRVDAALSDLRAELG
jgi:hypothetical protein